MVAAFGRLHNHGAGALGARPIVDVIVVDGVVKIVLKEHVPLHKEEWKMGKSPKMDACVRPPKSNVKNCFGKIKYMTSTTTCSRSSYSQITFSYMIYGGVNLTIQHGGGGGRQRFQSCGMLKCLVLYRVFFFF